MNIRILLFIIFTTHSFATMHAVFNPIRTWRQGRKLITRLFDKNRTLVCMSDGEMIHSTHGDEPKTVFTTGLCGCVATVFYTRDTDGIQQAILTHYPRNARSSQHADEFDRLTQQMQKLELSDAKLFVFGQPLEIDWYEKVDNEKGNPEEIIAEYEDIQQQLYQVARKNLEQDDLPIEYVPYKVLLFPGKPLGEVYATLSDQGIKVRVISWATDEKREYPGESL